MPILIFGEIKLQPLNFLYIFLKSIITHHTKSTQNQAKVKKQSFDCHGGERYDNGFSAMPVVCYAGK